MTKKIYTTTLERAGLGLLAGAATGGIAWLGLAALPNLQKGQFALSELVLAALPIWTFFSFIYLVALTLIGTPIWAALHALGRRGPISAVIAGAVLSYAAISLLFSGLADPFDAGVISAGAITAVVGAPVGWVIWRVAYRRADYHGQRASS